VGKAIGGASCGAEILTEIAMTAVTTVFKIHRALRSTERFEDIVTSVAAADLLDVLHRVLRLFALCKVSGDVAKEVQIHATVVIFQTPMTLITTHIVNTRKCDGNSILVFI